jgi:hypothetical protein
MSPLRNDGSSRLALQKGVEQGARQVENLVGYTAVGSTGLVRRQKDSGELPVERIDAHGGSDRAILSCDFPISFDLANRCRRQVGIERNVKLFHVSEASLGRMAFAGIEREASLDFRPSEGVSHDLIATSHQEIAEGCVLSPEIER